MKNGNEKKIRARYKAEAANYPNDSGYQAVVRDTNPDTGETRSVWIGKAVCKTQRDALAIGKVWIDAEVGRNFRLDLLQGRRQNELPKLLEKNMDRVDDLKSQRKDINDAIKKLETENASLVKETCHPEIEIVMYEASKTFAYAFVERGKRFEADDRQMGLFSEGVEDAAESGDEGNLPDIGDLAGGDGDED